MERQSVVVSSYFYLVKMLQYNALDNEQMEKVHPPSVFTIGFRNRSSVRMVFFARSETTFGLECRQSLNEESSFIVFFFGVSSGQ